MKKPVESRATREERVDVRALLSEQSTTLMTLFSTRLILTYDSSSSESLMSQIRHNINHFANGEWYKVVDNYLRIAPRHTGPL